MVCARKWEGEHWGSENGSFGKKTPTESSEFIARFKRILHVIKTFCRLHTHIYAFAHIHIYTYTHLHIYTCTHLRIYTYTHIPIYTFTRIHIYACTYTHIHMHMYIYTCTYTHIHINTHTHTYIYSVPQEDRQITTWKRPVDLFRFANMSIFSTCWYLQYFLIFDDFKCTVPCKFTGDTKDREACDS